MSLQRKILLKSVDFNTKKHLKSVDFHAARKDCQRAHGKL